LRQYPGSPRATFGESAVWTGALILRFPEVEPILSLRPTGESPSRCNYYSALPPIFKEMGHQLPVHEVSLLLRRRVDILKVLRFSVSLLCRETEQIRCKDVRPAK
jgi:hypothetical protein